MNIERYGTSGIVRDYDAGVIFAYERTTPRDLNLLRPSDKFGWDDDTYSFGDYEICPYGNSNDLPSLIQNVLFDNHMAPGLLTKKTQLLWGQGPKLYKERFVTDGEGKSKLIREWQDDSDIQPWLDSWAYEKYLETMCVDYNYIEGTFTQFRRNRGVRIGSTPFIAELEHVDPDCSRLAYEKTKKSKKPTHAIVTDYALNRRNVFPQDYRVYPLFDPQNAFAYANSIYYSNFYSFCMKVYSVPDIYGALEWIRRSTAVPLILKALSDNSLNIKYHITSPQEYWDNIEKELKQDCLDKNIKYENQMLVDFEKELFRKITRVLGGDENVGKLWHTKDVVMVDGTNLIQLGWKITPIKQDTKDYVAANLDISKHSDYAVATAIGLHPAIANISDSGKANGGSEQVYALQGYLLSGIDIPERIVMQPMNYALQANFPKKGLKMGFYQEVAQKQSDISPQNRIKEINPNG
jgi:hypothetical protein